MITPAEPHRGFKPPPATLNIPLDTAAKPPHLCPPHTMQSLSHSIARIPSLARSGMSLRRYDGGELLTSHPSPPARPMPPPLHLLDRARLAPYIPPSPLPPPQSQYTQTQH